MWKDLSCKKKLSHHIGSTYKRIICNGCEKIIYKGLSLSHICGEPAEIFKCDRCLYESIKFQNCQKSRDCNPYKKSKAVLGYIQQQEGGFSPPRDLTLTKKSSPHPNSSPNLNQV